VWWLVTLSLALGVLLRLVFVLSLPRQQVEPDEFDYVAAATGLLEQGSFERAVFYHVPPGTPVLFAGVFALSGPTYLAARVAQCLLYVPLGLVLFLLGSHVAGRTAGLLAVTFGALYPYFVFFSGIAQTETLGTVAISLMALMGVRAASRGRTVDAVGFGLALAAASLTRAAVFSFVLAVPLVYAIAWGVGNARWLRASAVSLIAFLALYLPWVGVNYRYFGAVVPAPTIGSGVMLYQTALRTTMPDPEERRAFLKREILPKYYNLAGGSHQDRLEGDRFLRREGVTIIRDNPGKYLGIVVQNITRFWQLYPHQSNDPATARLYKALGLASFGVLLPFFLVALWACRTRFGELSVLYGFMAYYTLVHALLYAMMRYRIPMDGIILVFAAAGLVTVAARCAPAALLRAETWLGTRAMPADGEVTP